MILNTKSDLVALVYCDVHPMVKEIIETTMIAGSDDLEGGVVPVPSVADWSDRISQAVVFALVEAVSEEKRNSFYTYILTQRGMQADPDPETVNRAAEKMLISELGKGKCWPDGYEDRLERYRELARVALEANNATG